MKKIFSFAKKKKNPSATPDSGSVLSFGYELKDKDLGKVHKAAAVGDLAKLKQLAKKNDLNQLDKENRTALHIACASGHAEVVQFLLESKAKLNLCDNQNRSALMKAVQCQHDRCVRVLLENHAEPNLVDINGNTALHLAANIPSISTAALLLEHEAEINAQNQEAFTPLTVAVREDHIEMAEFLLREGADVNFVDQDQRSPLMMAAGNGQISMLRLLLRFDADITLKDNKGWSADDYAVMNGHHPCSLLIIEHGTQRNNGQSLLHQGPSKKKKNTLLGHSSQNVETGFCLGGPAIDKEDFDDNSQSESLSRVSKNAAEWSSSEDDDELDLSNKKPQKVNLRKMIALKRGEASALPDKFLSGTESDPESENRVQSIPSLPKALPSSNALQHPVDPSPISFPSKAPQTTSTPLPSNRKGSSEAEDSEEEVGEEEEGEEEEEEEDDDDDDDDEVEDEDDDEEEEEEEDYEDEEDGEEDDEENECEEEEEVEEDGSCVASVKANTTELEEKPAVTSVLKIIDSADAQNIPGTDISHNSETSPGIIDETYPKTETPKNDIDRPVGTTSYALSATLGVQDDCIVSAVRVESKFSDEDDSLGSSAQNIISGMGTKEHLTLSRHHMETCSPVEVKEEEFERGMEKNDDDSGGNKQNIDDTAWNEGEVEENNQIGGFDRNTVLAKQRNVLEDFVRNEDNSSDAEDDAGTNKEVLKEKRRSSWGSSLDDSDNDLREEDVVNEQTVDKEGDAQASDLHPEAAAMHSKSVLHQPSKDHLDTTWDVSSPKCVSTRPVRDEPMSSLGLCSTGTPRSKKWHSSSENKDQNDTGSFTEAEVVPPISQTNIVTTNHPGEQQCCDGSWEEEGRESIERESDDPSAAVSPIPEDKNITRSQSLDSDGVMDSENEKDDDSSWDDEDESDESGKQKTTAEGNVLKTLSTLTNSLPPKLRSLGAIDKKSEEEAEEYAEIEDRETVTQSIIDGNDEPPENNRPEEKKLPAVERDDPSKDDDTSEDSDSKGQKLLYDFASTTVKVSDVGDKTLDGCLCEGNKFDDEYEAKLTAYVSLENRNAAQTRVSSGHPNEEPTRERFFSSPPTKDDVSAGQCHDSVGNSSDEVLPQTDIDEFDLDSPDEAGSFGMTSKEPRNIEEPAIQTEDSTGDESDDNEEEIDEEEEGDISDENDQPEESGESLNTTSPAPETEVSKDKKRDFLSELGLEQGEEEADSWDSESCSENPKMLHEEKQSLYTQDQKEMSTVKEEIKDTGNNDNGESGDEHVDKDTIQKETEKVNWEPLSVLSKLEGEKDQKTDLMEELGLGDVDDLEDASDWDSASNTSKRTLPGPRMASPVPEEFAECSNPSAKTQDEDNVPAAPTTPQRSINSSERLPSTPPQPVPRARKMALQRPESEEESDWEPDNLTSSSTAELQAVVKPGSSEPSSVTKDSYSNEESDQQQQKEKYHAVDTCELNQNSPCPSGHVGSDSGEKDNDLRGLRSLEGGGETVDNIPWEKRYEKLWVEVEKREVKSTFKNVAGELKEKFGELFKSRCPAESLTEEQQAMAEYASAEEESSDEEGEAIVRPMARARSTVLLTIPEQRESGPEDSVTESSDKPISQERMQVRERPSPESSMCREPDVNTLLKDDTKPGPVQTPHLDLTLKDTTVNLDEAVKSYVSSEEDLEEKSASLSGRRRSASIPGVSDEELEEDMERFKLEVGKLKVVFLDLEKEKAQLQKEVCRETVTSAMEVQKSSTFWDTGGTTLEEVGAEKPDTSLGFQSRQDGAIQQEQLPVATKSINGAPAQLHLPLEQRNSNKQEEQSIQEILQLELVRGAQHSTAPQTNSHVNGDPLSVFHDSSLSDMSDNEGRLSTSGQQENKNPEEMEMAEDFDEITQSSDTATDDMDSPTSGYRHASLLIQKLDSVTLDSRSMVKLQNIFHEYERSIQKARSRYCYLTDKVSHLEMERAEIKRSLEEVKDLKSGLERDQLELQTEVTNLKFQLKQEQENRRNATMMYNTTKDKLRRMEEQQQFEVQERQKVELTLRNLELEMGALVNNMKQLEEAHNETQRLLDQERSARTLQENLLSSHLRKQQEIEEENKRNMSKSNEALSQLTEASDRERELLQQNATLQEQLTILKTDLERSQANSSLRESHLWEEKEALKEQLEDARRDLKLNSEALTQTGFNCNNQVATLKSELAMTTNRLENERQTRETVETEVESTRTRLAGAVREAELCLAARTDAERALLREKEEHQRFKDRLTGEAASQREAISNLSQKLSVAEARANSMENEVHRVTLQLTEKGLLLDVLQREKDQASARVKELEMSLQAERELGSRAGARQEATQERLSQAQSDAMLLRQQLEEAQNKGVAKERAVTDAQERFSDILTKLRSDCEERVQLMEERNKELVSKAADLRDQIYKLEEEKNERETSLRQLQQELADALKKLSMSEASLEVNTRYRNDLEEEKARLFRDLDRLKGKLEESEDQYVQAEKRINGLKSMLDDREKELTSAAQKMQEAVSASAASHTTIKQLEEAVQRLEIENARLEAAAKQQSHKIDALQKGAQEAVMVRGHLEDLVTNLQSSKMTLEDQLSREVQKQSTLTHTAQDSQALWEEELKSRSKLGLRLAELEKEKGELSTQVEIEKKKAKKVSEQKKAVDTRLDEEMKRNTELQKEMYRLRTLLKTAKKKLREQDIGGTAFGSPMSSLRMDQGRPSQAEGGFGRMKDKVEDLRMQLEKESSHRCQVEKANGDLKDQLASLRSLSRNNDELERSKRKLEEEVLDLRRRMEACQMEQTQLELYRRDIEERARQDVQQKLDQVNLFMQSQAESQEALDRMREANENSLRSQLQQKIKEIEGELDRARTIQQDSLNQRESTRIELEQYQQLYREELRLRKSLDAKLERANCRLAEANSKLLNERSRSLISNGIGSLGGPALDVGSLGSSAHHGATLGPLTRSLGLGNSLLNPLPEGQSSGAEDYLTKLRRELDRSITHELTHAQAELDIASARLSPVGSASWVELDPVSRARQEYLEVLKRNHEI